MEETRPNADPATLSYNFDVQRILVLTLISVFSCYYLNFIWKKRYLLIKSWNFPGPINLPIIGSAYIFLCRPDYILDPLMGLYENYPTGLKMWMGPRLVYILNKPEQLEKILGSPKFVEKDGLYNNLTKCLGEGLLTAPAAKWKRHRKIIMPCFNQKLLDSFVEIFAEQSVVLTEILDEKRGKEVDLYPIVFKCTLEILMETMMGVKLEALKDNTDYVHTFDQILNLTMKRCIQVWNQVGFIWKAFGNEKELQGHIKKFNDLTDKVIQQKLEAVEAKKRKLSTGAYFEEAPVKRLTFLDHVIENGQFTAMELRDEVNIFLFTGTDTSSTAMTFLFTILGMYPDIQQKVYEEVIQVLGEERLATFADLPHLSYTERVIKETLRILPVGNMFGRDINEDIDMGDFVIPKGSAAYFHMLFIHRNPVYWPDPLKFDPDRFLPEEVAKRHPCAYIAFSFGPRNCIGYKYGMMDMKIQIAQVIRKLRIHCEHKKIEDIKLRANILLRLRDSSKVSMTRRNEETLN